MTHLTVIPRLMLSVTLLWIAGCNVASPQDPAEPVGDQLAEVTLVPQTVQQEIYDLRNGFGMRYAVSVPELPAGEKVPLVLALHFAGTITPYFGEDFMRGLVEPAFRDLGALIVAPDVPGGSWQDVISESSLLDFLNEAVEAWPVDPDRIVVTGYSMGGNGTWFLTARHPDLFSAGIPMASGPPLTIDVEVPLYVIHGEDDELFNVEQTRQVVDLLQERGRPVEFLQVDSVSHYVAFDTRYVEALRGTIDWLNEIWATP